MSPAVATLTRPEPAATFAHPRGVLGALLDQVREVVTLVPTAMYIARPGARVSGSVGEHVRHCLDHVAALLDGMGEAAMSYDRRRRGTTVEVDPATAVNEIERLLIRLDRISDVPLDRPVLLSSVIDVDGPPLFLPSTLGRELAFIIQHTIHHCALIALLLEWQGRRVPYGFGLAPATARARAS